MTWAFGRLEACLGNLVRLCLKAKLQRTEAVPWWESALLACVGPWGFSPALLNKTKQDAQGQATHPESHISGHMSQSTLSGLDFNETVYLGPTVGHRPT